MYTYMTFVKGVNIYCRYMDQYRDVKDLAEEAIKERLKIMSPFKPLPPIDTYGNITLGRHTGPSWLKRKQDLKWRRVGYFKDINVTLD